MKKIFFGNYKGGVGKTTSVFCIAKCLCEDYKKRVLLLDLDPQSSLSEICMKGSSGCSKKSLDELDNDECLNYVYDLNIRKIMMHKNLSLSFDFDRLIKHDGNFYFIPSNVYYPLHSTATRKLGLDELALQMNDDIEYMAILKNLLDDIEKHYAIKDDDGQIIKDATFDYIFIDCPPSNNIITKSAFLTSDYFAIPTILDTMSTNGVVHYIETVYDTYIRYCKDSDDAIFYRHIFGKIPRMLGIFYTLIRRQANYDDDRKIFEDSLNNAKEYALKIEKNNLAAMLGAEHIMTPCINNYIDIARSIASGDVPKDNDDYKALAKDFLRLAEGE